MHRQVEALVTCGFSIPCIYAMLRKQQQKKHLQERRKTSLEEPIYSIVKMKIKYAGVIIFGTCRNFLKFIINYFPLVREPLILCTQAFFSVE